MELNVKIVKLLPLQTGAGRNGEWKKQDIIVQTSGNYPKTICVSIWGDKIKNEQLLVGNSLKIDIEIESREYNGKWYTDVKAWRIELDTTNAPDSRENTTDINLQKNEDDDSILPF